MRDVLVALDGRTGNEKWRIDFVKEFAAPPPDFGFVSSPLLDDTAVYVQAGGAFVKIDKQTGKVLWRTLDDGGGMMGSAFSSPTFARLAGKDQILVQTRSKLAGVDPATGKTLWAREVPSFRGMNILTPTPFGTDGVFTSTYGGNTRLLRVTRDGERWSADEAWSLKYEGYMTSPVVVNGHAYFLGKDSRLLCLDLETGKEAWKTTDRFGEYWSLVSNGDKLLALDQRGTLYLLRANPQRYELLDKRKVAETDAWAHLALCGGEICIRDRTGLTLWRWGRQ
jgi:outer membrane protein assembly factor BamB